MNFTHNLESLRTRRRICSLRNLLLGAFSLTLVGLLAGSVSAASISYSGSWSMGLSPGDATVTLSQFDPSLGTLTEVDLLVDATETADVTAENDSVTGGSMGVDLTGLVTGKGPGGITPHASVGLSDSAGPVSVSATDGVPGSGPDFHDFGTLSDSDSDTGSIFSGFGAYTGLSTVAFEIHGSGGFSVSGVSDSTIHVTDFSANGDAQVTYFYTPVPEPSSLILLGLGSVGLLGIRRFRRK